MPNLTVYLTEEELAFVDDHDGSRSGVIREALQARMEGRV